MANREFELDAIDGYKIPVYEWSRKEQPIKGVVQIIHGSCEHAKRYDEFAKFLVSRGFAVYAHNHRGHGENAEKEKSLGFFAPQDGWRLLVEDSYEVTKYVKTLYPTKKVIVLGHSMGSFIARSYGIKYSEVVDGLILTGTAHHPKRLLQAGLSIAKRDIKLGRGRKVNNLLDYLSYGTFHYAFKKEKDKLSWLTKDVTVRDAFREDPYCGFKFTSSAFKDMFEGLLEITDEHQVGNMVKDLPIYLLSGQEDPVGDRGKMVKKAYEMYKKCGMQNVNYVLYPQMRHEILNEVGKEIVYRDILRWINSIG